MRHFARQAFAESVKRLPKICAYRFNSKFSPNNSGNRFSVLNG